MDSLLQEITMLPGVLGCFVFTGKQGVAASKMPPIFKANNIQTIGSLLARTMQMGLTAQLAFSDMEIKYNESMLLIKPIGREALLVIVSEPNANKSLIIMTSGMMLPDLETALKNPTVRTKQTLSPAPSQTAATPQAQKAPPVREAEIDEKLAPILEELRDALAMAIGPIAPPVMRDTIEIWAQQMPTTMDNLPALIKLLCQEINDTDLEKEFMDAYKGIIS